MTALTTALSWIAVFIAVAGAVACWIYAKRCNGDRLFFILAGLIQLYTAIIYAIALHADSYLIKSGIMTRLAAIAYAGLWLSFVISRGRCRGKQ